MALDHQRHTPAKHSKVNPEELGHMPFQDQQSMPKNLCYVSKISRRFASEWILVRGDATWTKTALAILQFWFHYFSMFPFEALIVYFPWETKEWYPSVVRTSLSISFLEYWNNHTFLLNFHATWHTRVNQRFPSVSAFNISSLISFSPAALPNFIPLIAVATSAAVETSSFPKCSLPVCHESMPLQDSKDFQNISSIMKGFHFYPVECYLQDLWWSKWHTIFCYVNSGWSVKILHLLRNSWNPTDN